MVFCVLDRGSCSQLVSPAYHSGWHWPRTSRLGFWSRSLDHGRRTATNLTWRWKSPDPRSKTLRLSQGVYFAPSVAAAGIAAHEAGPALQDAVDYFPLEARTYIVPVVQLASQTAPWLFIAGVMLQLPTLAWVGVILFGASSVFALITLPVEFNASARAQELLTSQGIIRGHEQIAGVQKVLGAAAWTYVAAAVSAIGSWLFYVFVLLSQARSAGFRR